jgi:RHS repeat-associated protein
VAAPGNYYTLQDNDGCSSIVVSGGQYYCGFSSTLYNPQNLILTAPDGTSYDINVNGGITGVQKPNGQTLTIGSGGVITNFGKSVTFTRDGTGRITNMTDPNKNQIQYSYDTLGRLSQVTDELGRVTTYQYAGSSNLISNILAPGNCQAVRNDYDDQGRVIRGTDASGNVTSYVYDSVNGTKTITNALGGAVTYKYDSSGNLLEVDDPFGGKTSYTYDANNNITGLTFPTGRQVLQTFDGNGNILTTTLVPVSGPSLTTTYTYTNLNKPVSIKFPSGSQQVVQYDAFGDLTSRALVSSSNTTLFSESFTYDANANQLTKTDALGNTTNYTYDAVGNLSKEVDPDGISTSYTYDANGNVTAKTDGLGNTTTFQYDGANNLTATIFGGQTISSSTWDSQNHLLSFTDALGKTASYGLDCSENATAVTDPLNFSTVYAYNGLQSSTSLIDPNGHVTAFGYDSLNRPTSRTTPDGASSAYSYTADSGVSQITLPSGANKTSTYDGYGRTLTETTPEKTITYTYDVDNNITQVQETTGSTTRTSTATYDSVDRLASYTDWEGRTVARTYDARNLLVTVTAPDGVVTTNSYDNAERLVKVQMGTASVQYTYDGAGRKSLETFSNGVTTAFTYDTQSRLTSVVTKNASNAVIASYNYQLDANGSRTLVTLPDGKVAYQYDADKRLLSEQSTSPTVGVFTHASSYDGAGNRLDSGTSFGPDNRLLQDAGGAYTYDKAGNRTARGTQTYGYDTYNHLTSYANPSTGTTAAYQYDWVGRRLSKAVNGTTREFIYDQVNAIAEYDGGVPVAHYAYGPNLDEVLIVNRGGANYFYHLDGLGSVIAITDSNGNVVQRYAYDAWGNLKQNSGSFAFSGTGLVNNFTYTGREYDSESGLYHYRSRAYDPAIGRFLQKDATQGKHLDPQTLDVYAYVSNNPVNSTDPSGGEALVEEGIPYNSSLNKAAAAFIGYFVGFAATELEFVGNYLALVGAGKTGAQLNALALGQTLNGINSLESTLGTGDQITSKIQGIAGVQSVVPGTSAGFYGAFGSGFGLADYIPGAPVSKQEGAFVIPIFSLTLTISEKLNIAGPTVYGAPGSVGGFSGGAALALTVLYSEFGPNQ